MDEISERYQMHFRDKAGEMLPSELIDLIADFMDSAVVNMGGDYDDKTLKRVASFISGEFGYLPIMAIASAFSRGSLGFYGTGRLVPKTIYGWLRETAAEFNRQLESKARQSDLADHLVTKVDLDRYPLGQAINKKFDWLGSGAITEQEYDQIPLKEVAELIGRGITPTLEMFGITPKF